MSSRSLYILWDESHIWGLLAWRGALGLGVPFRMVRAEEIAKGLLGRDPCAVLLVPGGTARHKAAALGARGLQNIRDYVAGGGHYLGFCGGAGLGLTLSAQDEAEKQDETGKSDEAGKDIPQYSCQPEQPFATSPSVQHSPPGQPDEIAQPENRADNDKRGHTTDPTPGSDEKNASGESLNLCPWARAGFEERIQHFMSGHLEANLADARELPEFARRMLPGGDISAAPVCSLYGASLRTGESFTGKENVISLECGSGIPLIPVWWPGRFLPGESGADKVAVLARYSTPGPDFWLADLPIALLPEDAFGTWRELYGINFSPAFLEGQPCVVHGQYALGSYTLSYSHLETPGSPFANNWLAHILKTLGNIETKSNFVPPWKPEKEAKEGKERLPGLTVCIEDIAKVLRTGMEHGLFFRRNDWLFGWRTGMPGAAMNNLNSALLSCAALPAAKAALEFWQSHRAEISEKTARFSAEAINYLLAERLAMTLNKSAPGAISAGALKAHRQSLFGPPMKPGGLYAELISFFENLLFLQFRNEA